MKLETKLDQIHRDDCIDGMKSLSAGSVKLAFADPPFNIGYDYDEYDDRMETEKYIEWSNQWMTEVHRVLSDDGAFWLAIGDEYAAELKVEAQKIGFCTRSWVVWYYTFGVHCKYKFTRSHAHIFHFAKDDANYIFNREAIAVPSARQLVYGDKRANAGGRIPDDTWILRPQDCVDGFTADEDTWYFPRVAGTFKERAGFHGCQMPEQLLGRIIRTCSDEGDVVMDPFGGSGTTLAVAKKLGRHFLGFEMSKDYAELGNRRLESVCVGDDLEGSPEPKASAPASHSSKARRSKNAPPEPRSPDRRGFENTQLELPNMDDADDQIIEAFSKANRGYSVDRVVADPVLAEDFQIQCDRRKISGTAAERNRSLFRIRKSGKLKRAGIETRKRTSFQWEDLDRCLFASEIAWRQISERYDDAGLDEILCDPRLAQQFDSVANDYAGAGSPLQHRWAAVKLRKEAVQARKRAKRTDASELGIEKFQDDHFVALSEQSLTDLPSSPGVYAIRHHDVGFLYVGETANLNARLRLQLASSARTHWPADQQDTSKLLIAVHPLGTITDARLARQSLLQKWHQPAWNFNDLIAV